MTVSDKFSKSRNSVAPVTNIAHRGARAFAPENTLAAFAKAKAIGSQMVELDARIAKDGVLMVQHDEDLLRCTDVHAKFPNRGQDPFHTFTSSELQQLDAGSWYIKQLALPAALRQEFLRTLTDQERTQFVSPEDEYYYASGEIKLPTLQEALELAEQLNLRVNIELKGAFADRAYFAQTLVALISDLKATQRVLVSSFEHDLLQQVRQLTPSIATAVLTVDPIENAAAYLQALGANAYHPNCYKTNPETGVRELQLGAIQNVLAAGFAVNVWTCNNPQDMRRLLEAGITGLVSDYPNRVRALLELES